MPTYEYKCDDCGYQFEQSQGMNDDPLEFCPVCHGSVKRLVRETPCEKPPCDT
jgi:putative FmdB family regulatory protein